MPVTTSGKVTLALLVFIVLVSLALRVNGVSGTLHTGVSRLEHRLEHALDVETPQNTPKPQETPSNNGF